MKDSDRFIPFENLPDRFVESLERISEPPVAPRPAATIVLMRDVEPGIEILHTLTPLIVCMAPSRTRETP